MLEKTTEPDAQAQPSTIWHALDSWAQSLAPWQQFVVRTAVAQGQLTDEQVSEAYAQFLVNRKLAEAAPDAPAPTAAQSRPAAPLADALTLTKVDALQGVNALPASAVLTFGPQLTVIYGQNGAGKSGFARIFSNACFSRQRSEIIPNINADGPAPRVAATFHYSIGAEAQAPLVFGSSSDISALRRITVFDSAVARHHITQSAAFEFRPAGFDVFPELARVYGLMNSKLDQDINRRSSPNTFSTSFLGGGTPVHDAVAGLNAKTDLAPLRQLSHYGPTESARITELDAQILALRTKSTKEALAALREAKTDLAALSARLRKLAFSFSQTEVTRRAALTNEARDAAAVAVALGSDQFKRPFFNAVGSSEWEDFVSGVKLLAEREDGGYPREGDPCLLCERFLDAPSAEHIAALLRFASGDARRHSIAAKDNVSDEVARLLALDFGVFTEETRVRTHVHRLAPQTETVLLDTIARLEEARASALLHLEDLLDAELAFDLEPINAALAALDQKIDGDIVLLTAEDTEASIASLEYERRVLRHRHVLSQLFPAIETFVKDQAWIAKATTARTVFDTRAVTLKEKELFERIVGGDYRERFANECANLDCRVPIELQTAGQRGQTVRSLAIKGGHKPDTILSEGEQRAVALADFLTEVSLNPASAGVVLDDPVTSQDHERRRRIAARLVVEAKARQVIVFTHDLVFLNALFEEGADTDVLVKYHWIQRDGQGRPGLVSLDDAPKTIKIHETTKLAEEALKAAETASGSEREQAIRRGMSTLRRTLEEIVVRKLFKEVVPRWSDKVRVTALKKINWDNAKVDEVSALYEDLSRYIEGHSHTEEAMGAPPEPADLKVRIEQVNRLINWAKSDRT